MLALQAPVARFLYSQLIELLSGEVLLSGNKNEEMRMTGLGDCSRCFRALGERQMQRKYFESALSKGKVLSES